MLFAIEPKLFWDDQTISGKGGRWRVVFYSANVLDLLVSLGIDLAAKARDKHIPDCILQSPKSVVSAFLRAYFDCDGCASLKSGVILSTFSARIAETLQILLLNYGILSRKHGPNMSHRRPLGQNLRERDRIRLGTQARQAAQLYCQSQMVQDRGSE